jgi:Ala-tRNA(Pro) deacylase
MPTQRLRKYLDDHMIKYTVINHSLAYSALEVAQSAHISGKIIAKTIILKIDQQTAMVVLPAPFKVNIDFFKDLSETNNVRLATEKEVQEIFPDCEIGAMPPFGNLYSIDVYVATQLTEDEEIAFNAGNHRQLIQMKYVDFERLVHPVVFDLTSEPSEWKLRF